MPVTSAASARDSSRPFQCSRSGFASVTNRISRRDALPGISTRIESCWVKPGQVVEVAVLPVLVVDVERVVARRRR